MSKRKLIYKVIRTTVEVCETEVFERALMPGEQPAESALDKARDGCDWSTLDKHYEVELVSSLPNGRN